MDICLDLVDCYSALPKDPILRKQQLEELMMTSHSSFTFMQVRYGWIPVENMSLSSGCTR